MKKNYVLILSHGHHRADTRGYVREHILVAEKTLGKPLPLKAVIHHHTPEQLVICQDQAYHNLLHQRQRAYEACGYTSWRKCTYCKQYNDPSNMYIWPKGNMAIHPDCRKAYRGQR